MTPTPVEMTLVGILVALGCLALVLVWLWFRPRLQETISLAPGPKWGLMALVSSVVLGVFAYGCSRVVVLATPLPWILAALMGGILLEGLTAAYRRELAEMSPLAARRVRMLRGASALLIFFMILQPVFVWWHDLRPERVIAVLVDDSASMRMMDGNPEATRARSDIAHQTLLGENGGEGLLAKLQEKHAVRIFRFGGTLEPTGSEALALVQTQRVDEVKAPNRLRSDIAGSLEAVLEHIPDNRLAGLVVLGDGRHNGERSVDEIAREFGTLGVPIGGIPVGSDEGIPDAAIYSVKAPETIFLGDRLAVAADIRFHSLRGKEVTVQLKQGDEILDDQKVRISEDRFQEQVRFSWKPESSGTHDLQVVVSPVEGEFLTGNNTWPLHVAVSDDRTFVLLVDQKPRWEFRYLRNLFYGRDKSVHLQYVLFEPDRIMGQREPEPRPASASREFGDSEANALPSSREEWRRFDVIIIGDVEADRMTDDDWEEVQGCVAERGALLVLVCGPDALPSRMTSGTLETLLPFQESAGLAWSTEEPFRVGLTATGRRHSIPRQSPDSEETALIWREAPSSMGRVTHRGLREDVEVLLVAEADTPEKTSADFGNLEEAVNALKERREREASRALLTVQKLGAGKIVTMLYDQTWRLRYGVGDTYHHRFWGQIVRWGAGPSMRAGNDQVRLGTDHLVYTPFEPVRVTARLLGEDRMPIEDAKPEVRITREGVEISRAALKAAEITGIWEAELPAIPEPGMYEIELVSKELTEDQQPKAGFEVVTTRDPRELAELSADPETFDRLAKWTDGVVASPDDTEALIERFNQDSEPVVEAREKPLWNQWPVVCFLLILLTAEWVIRRKEGLL